MTYALRFEPGRVRKELDRIEPEKDRRAILQAVGRLLADPFGPGLDIKRLAGGEEGYRLRVGDWRIRYKLSTADRVLTVTSVLNRRDAYR